MHLRFGIQEKTALLVMAVAVVVAVGTSLVLQRISARMVEEHELVDLDDESNLRAWSIIDQVNSFRAELGLLASDEAVRLAVYKGETDPIQERGFNVCRQWPLYTNVQVVDAIRDDDPIDVVERMRGIPVEERSKLVEAAECEERAIPLVSKHSKVQAEVLAPGSGGQPGLTWVSRWVSFCWGCARVVPPEGWDGPVRYICMTLPLEQFSSPRHLLFLVDAGDEKMPFLIHPDMSTESGLGEDGMFEVNLRKELNEKRDASVSNRYARIERIALLLGEPLKEDFTFYFREGTPSKALAKVLKDKRKNSPEDFELFFDGLSAEFESMGRKLGGLSVRVKDIRLLARDPTDLDPNYRGERAPNYIQSVEAAMKEYASIAPRDKGFHWKDLLPCRHCHISCLTLNVDTVEGPRQYLMMYAAFQEEFVGAIRHEIQSKLLWYVIAFGLAALAVAFAVAVFFVQPLRQMTATAQNIVKEEGRLHDKIAELLPTLPIGRNDEVGDIAQASERLFQEVVISHEQLEERVRERTRELERANEKLEGLAKEKDAFLANVSHELRTPLTAVSGFLQLLGRKKTLGEKEKNYVGKALSASAHLETLIDDILDFQKIIMGGITLDPTDFDAGKVLSELSDALQFQAKKNNNQLEFTWTRRVGMVHTDRQRLRQVLTNLVTNGCKFTRNGVVSIEADTFKRGKRAWIRFRVSDTGRGMNKEEQKMLFTRFYTTKKQNAGGTGLGLVICEGLCKLMGGRVFLERSMPGDGSTFTVELPQRIAGPDPESVSDEESETATLD